jgi:hypothetical protein
VPIVAIIRKNAIPQVQGSIVEKTVDSVRDSSTFMRDAARTIAPVDTGAFRASIYINGPNDESDYAQSAANAKGLRPRANIVPELQAATLDPSVARLRDRLGRFSLPEAVVSSAVEYSLYLEEGTAFMSPRPTFKNAALMTEQVFKASMSKVADGF